MRALRGNPPGVYRRGVAMRLLGGPRTDAELDDRRSAAGCREVVAASAYSAIRAVPDQAPWASSTHRRSPGVDQRSGWLGPMPSVGAIAVGRSVGRRSVGRSVSNRNPWGRQACHPGKGNEGNGFGVRDV